MDSCLKNRNPQKGGMIPKQRSIPSKARVGPPPSFSWSIADARGELLNDTHRAEIVSCKPRQAFLGLEEYRIRRWRKREGGYRSGRTGASAVCRGGEDES